MTNAERKISHKDADWVLEWYETTPIGPRAVKTASTDRLMARAKWLFEGLGEGEGIEAQRIDDELLRRQEDAVGEQVVFTEHGVGLIWKDGVLIGAML
jgi:hypothetical protein